MNHQPLVSVIMPAYNAAKFIGLSIESALNQSYENLELIIVNDGSTDDTADVIARYMTRDNRIKYLEQENGRQGKARNTGIRNSSGEIIALLDADDLWEKDLLAKQLDLLIVHNVDCVYSNVQVLYDEVPYGKTGVYFDLSGGMALGRYDGKDFFRLLVQSNRVVTQTAFFKKSAAEKVGLFEEKLEFQNCEDYDLWLRLAFSGASFYGNAEILGTYRKHASGSISDTIKQLRPEIRVIDRLHRRNMISVAQWKKTITWLSRVMLLNLSLEGRWQEILDILKKMDPIAFLPKGVLYHIIFLLYDNAMLNSKKLVKRIVKVK